MGMLHREDPREEELRRACKLTVFSCGDYRHDEQFRHAIEREYGLGVRYDQLVIPGGAYALANDDGDEHEAEYLVRALRTYIGLHGQETMVVVLHTECGRYARSHHFESRAHETSALRRDLRLIQQRLRVEFPETRIDLCIAHIHGEWLERLEVIMIEHAPRRLSSSTEHAVVGTAD